MANKFQIKRTTVSGRTPNTTNSGNTAYIDAGELAINLLDRKLFSSNGTASFEVGANLTNLTVTSITANGTLGTNGYVLTTNGSTVFWSQSTASGGLITFSNTAPVSPSVGDEWIDSESGIKYTYFDDGSSSQWVEIEASTSFTSGGSANLQSVSSSIIPSANVTYDIGSSTMRWRDLYLAGNTINLGGAQLKTDAGSGALLIVPPPTEAIPNPKATLVSPSGSITAIETTNGVVNSASVASVSNSTSDAFFLNNNTVTSSVTIPTGKNAISGGPITIAANVEVTISSGSEWTVV